MAYKPAMRILIIGFYVVHNHKCFDFCKNSCIDIRTYKTVLVRNYGMGTACIKTHDNIPVFVRSHRKLGFVSIPVWVVHTDNRRYFYAAKPTDPYKIVLYKMTLEFKLSFIAHCHKGTAPTGFRNRTFCFNTVL